jgi:hypothetical protein
MRMWPTPTSLSFAGSHQPGNNRNQNKTMDLAAAMWPTPQAHDCVNGKTPDQVQAMRDRTGAGVSNLNEVAAMWATPNAHDVRRPGADLKSTQGANLSREASLWDFPQAQRTPTHGASGLSAAVLNPQFVEALMGFHIGWTAFAPSETPSSPKSPRSRGKCSAGG